VLKGSIDMHLRSYRVVTQQGHLAPKPARKFDPAAFYQWLEKQIRQYEQVVICYEAGCFGFEPARRMIKMGAQVLVIAPQNWDEKGKRQVNDRMDALVMCRRLSEYLDGHEDALTVVRIPTPEEEIRRRPVRMREQLRKQIRRMGAMGRSLLLQREMAVTGRWWAGRLWNRIVAQMPGWVVQELEVWRELLIQTERKAQEVESQLRKEAPKEGLFVGEGNLSHELLDRELVDPNRFKNSRQVGNYYGLCPSESSSGELRQLGSITKRGNPRLRRLIIELAWRVVRFQPDYEGTRMWGPVLHDRKLGSGRRKKAIVALARKLAVDLWRIATGRKTAKELGLVLKSA